MMLKVRNLDQQIRKERSSVEQNKLIAQQNKLLGYMSGLGIAVGGTDRSLLRKLGQYKG